MGKQLDLTIDLINNLRSRNLLHNSLKTKVMVFSKKYIGCNINIEGVLIEQITSFKYLGFILNVNGKFVHK